MEKKLAIIGHPTRGKEVIELLEMIGGKNCYNLSGLFTDYGYYFIGGPHNVEIRGEEYIFGNEDICLFTLEEFLEKYPFKVGDKVVYTKFGDNYDEYPDIIESMKWTGTTIEYTFNDCVTCLAKDLKMWNSNDNYAKPSKMKIVLAELLEHIKTTPKEDLEREFNELEEWSNVGPTVEEFMTFCECVNKKLVYPKTYEECCKNVLRMVHWGMTVDVPMHYSPLIINFTKLLICRNAYWKIAGERMGLGEPWEPDWTNLDQLKYCIWVDVGEFITMINVRGQHILAFPTEEMRDTFHENFKDLIEKCKELL